MKKVFMNIFLLSLFIPMGIHADESQIDVVDMKFCTQISKREPVGVSDTFSNMFEKVYCYTEISGANPPTTISHLWFHEGNQMAEVPLNIKSSSWRTWSSKRIMKSWTGRWTVKVLSEDGRILKEKGFIVGSGPDYELNEY